MAETSGGTEVRVFLRTARGTEIEGSHARVFPMMPAVGQTLVFGRPTGELIVYQVVETGFFLWPEGTSTWLLATPKAGSHAAPSGYYDPIAAAF